MPKSCTRTKKSLLKFQQEFTVSLLVRSAGVEPTLSAPEANVLSTGLRALKIKLLRNEFSHEAYYTIIFHVPQDH